MAVSKAPTTFLSVSGVNNRVCESACHAYSGLACYPASTPIAAQMLSAYEVCIRQRLIRPRKEYKPFDGPFAFLLTGYLHP